MNELMSSIIMDFGEIPDDYLEPAGPGEYDPALFNDEHEDPESVWSGVYHEEGAHLYPEWDYRRQNYRKNWCAVREKTVVPVHDDFCEKALEKYQGLVKHLRKTFEAMREGIHPYCITIDEETRDYLPHLYGPAAFTLVSEVRELPVKVSDIYRRLTT